VQIGIRSRPVGQKRCERARHDCEAASLFGSVANSHPLLKFRQELWVRARSRNTCRKGNGGRAIQAEARTTERIIKALRATPDGIVPGGPTGREFSNRLSNGNGT
jgi:hypothetical protein